MTETIMTFHPSILPESADPIGSTRYECYIMHTRTQSEMDSVKCYDDIAEHELFLVDEYSPEFKDEYAVDIFLGTVLKESNGIYSWWRNIVGSG